MKARVKETGEIVDVEDMSIVTYKSDDGTYVKTLIKNFTFIDAEKDYYTKLEHQYAGMAMQSMLSNTSLVSILFDATKDHDEMLKEVVICSHEYATELVEKLKNE